jgi:hypothetical protein
MIAAADGILYAHATTTCLVLDAQSAAGSQARPAAGLNGSQQLPGDKGDGH